MADEEKKPESASIPAWQRTEAASTDEKPSSTTATTTTTKEATPAPAAQASETATADARAASGPRTESAQASSDPEPEKSSSSNNEKALVKLEPSIGSDEEDEEGREEQNDRLTVARRFLDDEDVRSAPRSRKVAFLQSKGVSTTDIETLIGPEKTITVCS